MHACQYWGVATLWCTVRCQCVGGRDTRLWMDDGLLQLVSVFIAGRMLSRVVPKLSGF
jgi:hypothetical protein